MESFDPKPMLNKLAGKAIGETRFKYVQDRDRLKKVRVVVVNDANGQQRNKLYPLQVGYKKYGQSGIEVSDLFPHIGSVADDLCVIRSMQNINGDHFGATLGIHTGSATFARPSIGSWLSYGLGTENRNLPAFVVISPGLPYAGDQVWSADFLPAIHQGTRVIPRATPIANMHPQSSLEVQRTELDILNYFNHQHLQGRANDDQLTSRIQSFETAAGMQLAAPEVFDLSSESKSTHDLYGLKPGESSGFGWQCLVARRLAERGVRFIELIDGDTNIDSNWDAHAKMATYNKLSRNVDQPIAALIQDLKQRGLLDETLVVWGTEFGRTPLLQSDRSKPGRDHHKEAYSVWMAGGGIKGGVTFGETDPLGYFPADNPVDVNDWHATILHLLGVDHEQLTYKYQGRQFRLTDVSGNVLSPLLA